MERNNRFLCLMIFDDLTWILVLSTYFCTSSAGYSTVKGSEKLCSCNLHSVADFLGRRLWPFKEDSETNNVLIDLFRELWCYVLSMQWTRLMRNHIEQIDFCGASQVGLVVKNLPVMQETWDTGSIPGSGRFPQRRKWQPTLVFLPGESHGQRSLVG